MPGLKKGKTIHIKPDGERWAVIRDGVAKPIAYHNQLQDAVNHGRNIAKRDHSELWTYNREEQVKVREDYSGTMTPTSR